MSAVYVRETKTTSFDIGLGSTYWKKLALDNQISTYMVGARALGHDPDGIQYDVLRKPTLMPYRATLEENRKYTEPKSRACAACKKKGGLETAPHTEVLVDKETNVERSVQCVEGRIVTDEGGRLHANMRETEESPFEYRDRILADIYEDPDRYYQRGIIPRLEAEERDAAFDAWCTADQIRLSQNAARWPRNTNSCSQYNRMCDFWEVCSGVTDISNPIQFEPNQAHRELLVRTRLPLLTNSSQSSFKACPKKYFFEYESGIRAKVQDPKLDFGTRMHAAIAAWLLNNRDLDKGLSALMIKPEAYDHEDAKAEAMFRGYHERWSTETYQVLAVEQEFTTDLRNPDSGAASRTWKLAGKLDAVVQK